MAADNPDTIATRVALLSQQIEFFGRQLTQLENKIDDGNDKIAKIEEMASRWKGGFLVIAGIGGLLGWIASVWDKVTKPWH